MSESASKHAQHEHHPVPLMWLFLTLLAFTAAEYGIFEIWSYTYQQGNPFIPKVAMVLLILVVLTLPKAAIVMIYFMHLKFEKHLVIFLAVIPLLFAAIAVLPTLSDIMTNQPRNFTQDSHLAEYELDRGGHGEEHGASDAGHDEHASDDDH